VAGSRSKPSGTTPERATELSTGEKFELVAAKFDHEQQPTESTKFHIQFQVPEPRLRFVVVLVSV
jgi:hypothetical protein